MDMRRRFVLMVCVSVAACLASQADAQVAAVPTGRPVPAADDAAGEDIVVTGTSIRGANPIGNTVLRIDADAVAASGRSTVADYLRELPSNFAGGVGLSDNVQGAQDASIAGSNLTGGQGVNLRALGSLSTLVLVNGRRVASAGQYGDFVDISTIPNIAIDRIEVLQDGASAIYGSDAVAGVVNIVLKDRDDGLRTSARLGTTTQGGGGEAILGASWGRSWGTGNILLGYEYQTREAVRSDQRDIYNGGDFSDRGGVNWPRFAGRAGTAANIFSTAASGLGTVAYTVPQGPGTGLTVARLTRVTDGVGNTFDPWANIDILPDVERHSGTLAFAQESGGVRLSGDARYTDRRSRYNAGYATLYGTVPATNPAFITGTTNNFGVRIDDVGLVRDARVRSFAGHLGLTIDLGDRWTATIDGSYSNERQSQTATGLRDTNIRERIPSGATTIAAPSSITCALSGLTAANPGTTPAQRFCAAQGYAAFNPYGTDPLPAAVVGQLIGYQRLRYTSWLAQGSAKVDGTLFALPGGDAKLAMGADYRKESISGDLDFNLRSIAPYALPYGTTRREVAAAFAEVAIPIFSAANARPLLRSLALSGAVRYEHGSGLGGFDTVNPKFGADWSPISGVRLHGSWGTSFHAPPMRYAYNGAQPTTGGNGAFTIASLYTAPCTTTLVRLNGVTGTPGGAGNCTFTTIIVTGGAGATLRPETAETGTLGADVTPGFAPGLRLSANYFNIGIDDRIVRIQAGTLGSILANYFATGSSPYAAALDFSPSLATVQGLMSDPRYVGQNGTGPVQSAADVAAVIYATQTNLAALRMDGVDLSLDYRLPTARAGTFGLFASGTLLTSYRVQAAPGQPFVNQLGRYSAVGNPVAFRSRQGVSWRFGRFSATGTVNYTDDYQCASGCYVPDAATGAPVLNTAPVRIGSWTTFDLQLGVALDGLNPWLRDATIALSLVNLTNNRPPFIDGGTAANDVLADAYDAANATVVGRAVALTFGTRF